MTTLPTWFVLIIAIVMYLIGRRDGGTKRLEIRFENPEGDHGRMRFAGAPELMEKISATIREHSERMR